jgi:hypothetical protein
MGYVSELLTIEERAAYLAFCGGWMSSQNAGVRVAPAPDEVG